jgi:hypothetical protein
VLHCILATLRLPVDSWTYPRHTVMVGPVSRRRMQYIRRTGVARGTMERRKHPCARRLVHTRMQCSIRSPHCCMIYIGNRVQGWTVLQHLPVHSTRDNKDIHASVTRRGKAMQYETHRWNDKEDTIYDWYSQYMYNTNHAVTNINQSALFLSRGL